MNMKCEKIIVNDENEKDLPPTYKYINTTLDKLYKVMDDLNDDFRNDREMDADKYRSVILSIATTYFSKTIQMVATLTIPMGHVDEFIDDLLITSKESIKQMIGHEMNITNDKKIKNGQLQ